MSKRHANRNVFTDEDKKAVEIYLSSSRCELSAFDRTGIIADYEDALADYFDRKYCMLTNSGTNALFAAFFAIGIGPGDEIIASTYTFHATISPALQLGANIILGDIEESIGNLCPIDVSKKITNRTKAIVVTHQWGHPVELAQFRKLADQNNLLLIEDISLAIGSTYHDSLAGSVGDVSCFSLGSTKLLSGGQGGALITNSSEIWERANLLCHFGPRAFSTVKSPIYRQFADTGFGFNFRIHTLSAAISYSRFKRKEELIEARHERYNMLSSYLEKSGLLIPPKTKEGCFRGSWHGYVALGKGTIELKKITNALLNEGLEIRIGGYYPLLHLRRIFQTTRDGLQIYEKTNTVRNKYKLGDFPKAELHVSNSIAFPLFLNEDFSMIKNYGNAILRVANKLKIK